MTYTTIQLYKLPDIEIKIRYQTFSDPIIVRNPNFGALASGLSKVQRGSLFTFQPPFWKLIMRQKSVVDLI